MNIGFDLDGIFVDIHPLIPKKIVEWLYRGPQDHEPKYRFPATKFERKIRAWSHKLFLRPKISKNIEFLKEVSNNPKNHLYLISSRYSFLEDSTLSLLVNYNLKNHFSKIYLNSGDEQPHIFKKRILEKLNLDIFVEDDLMLLCYLQKFFPKTRLLWYNPNSVKKNYSDITHIKNLKELRNYLK